LAFSLSYDELFHLAYFIIPAYVANGMPVLFGGGQPLDLGKSFFDGERIFGINKTTRGFISGILLGSLVSLIMELILMGGLLVLGILAALGSLLGDLCGSFLKRRLGLKPGSPLPLIDQLDFVIGALVVTYPLYNFSIEMILLVLFMTPPIHITANAIAYALKLKDAFW